MDKIKVGDKLKIECFKHNGFLDQTSEEATVVFVSEEMLVVANDRTKLIEHNGQLKKNGLFYYCNIATPYIIDGHTIKYIDYDLDLRVFPDGGFRVLDRNEYKYHRHLMKYGKDLNSIIENSLSELIELKKNNSYPFQKEIVEKFYQKFLEIKEK